MAKPRQSKAGASFSGFKSTGVRAGKSKGSEVQRKVQNIGVKHGTVRKGAKGKGYNVYDAKTGTWTKAARVTVSSRMPSASKSARTKSRTATGRSTTVGAAPRSGKAWYSQGGGGLAGPNSPLPGMDRRAAAAASSAASSALSGFKSGVKSASTGVTSAVTSTKKKLPPTKYFGQGGGGLYGWLKGR